MEQNDQFTELNEPVMNISPTPASYHRPRQMEPFLATLAAGATQTFHVNINPDFFLITVIGAAGVNVSVSLGNAHDGTNNFRLGDGGYLKIPGMGTVKAITVFNAGSPDAAIRMQAVTGYDLQYYPGRSY